jgi:hypothetical protein
LSVYNIPIWPSNPDISIDYACDDEKRNSWVGGTSWYHCVADDSRIPKMLVFNPFQALVHPQTQKKTILHGLSIPNPNFSEFTLFGKKICRLGIVDVNLPSN